MTATKTKVTVQFYAPINVELEVDDTSDESILKAAWEDLKDPDSPNAWEADYFDLKEAVRSAEFLENASDDFYIAQC